MFNLYYSPEIVVHFAKAAKDDEVQVCKTIEKCSQSTFRSVTELSLGNERSPDNLGVDMVSLSVLLLNYL